MLACLLLLLVAPASDTMLTQVAGTVSDTAGVPVAVAQVRLDSLDWRPVSRAGGYSLSTVPGRHLLAVRAVGFDPVEVPLEVGTTRLRVNLRMTRTTRLAGVEVTARRGRSSGADRSSGFDTRRGTSVGGIFLDSTAIAQRSAARTSDLLRALPGLALVPVTNPLGTTDYVLVMRGTTTVYRDVCPIQYYLDGHPFAAEDNIDRMVSPQQIAAVEVYHGASDTPLEFRGPTARCGVIVIWTKH